MYPDQCLLTIIVWTPALFIIPRIKPQSCFEVLNWIVELVALHTDVGVYSKSTFAE